MNRLLHLGLGNFARAHVMDYTQDAGGWAVTGVSMRSATIRDGLKAQDFDYTLRIHGEGDKRIHVIDKVIVAPEEGQAVIDAIADPNVQVITMTVTEKGYHLDADGLLDLADPMIAREVRGDPPTTAIGFLANGLGKRATPVTVLSCDNRESNGDVLGRAIGDFIDAAGLRMTAEVRFPNSMVDRITPATTDRLRQETGDPMAVPTEAFREWVIEDFFVGARPIWPGVQYVEDVKPHEARKLRMLNGAHSYLAYAGLLRGHTYVHEAIADPGLRRNAQALMMEAAQTLDPDVQEQAEGYAAALLSRFEIPEIAHALRQIAMDGTQKLPYRVIATLRDRTRRNLPSPALTSALSAWVTFCRKEVAEGLALQDPMAEDIARDANAPALLKLIGAEDISVE